MHDVIKHIARDETGGTAVEYGLILALVFLAVVGAVANVGTDTINMWDSVSEDVENANKKAS